MNAIEVLAAGPLTTVQDRGRPGWAHIGVSPSGAVDQPALERGNRLVGNESGAAALEATLIGPRLRFRAQALVALTGAVSRGPFEVGAGDVLEVGQCRDGVRAYVSVRGGIDVEPVLGSRSTDLMSGLGPAALQDGDLISFGPEPNDKPQELEPQPPLIEEPVLRVLLGPRDDWFDSTALEALAQDPWQVGLSSNRIGVRLEGPQLERARHDELLSEGLVTGAMQVPPSGQPILLLNDHPTTGGYPVIGVVRADDLPLAGQLRPGQKVRFEVNQGSQP
jgi:biotin-dependent carboxylase-like uncharacterized protein